MSYYSDFERPEQARQDDLDEIHLIVNLAKAARAVIIGADKSSAEAADAINGIRVAIGKAALQLNHTDAASAVREFAEALILEDLDLDDFDALCADTVQVAMSMVEAGKRSAL